MDKLIKKTRVEEKYGSVLELEITDTSSHIDLCTLRMEFEYENKDYVIVQKSDGDLELFSLQWNETDPLNILPIEDDEEWETIFELFDEYFFSEELDCLENDI